MARVNHVTTGAVAREGRRKRAKTDVEFFGNLTPQQKLARLDARLGEGKGATRERARLAKKIG